MKNLSSNADICSAISNQQPINRFFCFYLTLTTLIPASSPLLSSFQNLICNLKALSPFSLLSSFDIKFYIHFSSSSSSTESR